MKIKIAGLFLFALTIGAVLSIPPRGKARRGRSGDRIPGSEPTRRRCRLRPRYDRQHVRPDPDGEGEDLVHRVDDGFGAADARHSDRPRGLPRPGRCVCHPRRGPERQPRCRLFGTDVVRGRRRWRHPESVNKALYDAVNEMSWSDRDQAYQAIFLVGDAPPHMDYNEARYPDIIAAATRKGIVVNTIQCGESPDNGRSLDVDRQPRQR